MISALGYERSERGFESRQPESDFSSTHQKTEEKSAVPRQWHLQPLATITLDEAQQLRLSRTTYISPQYKLLEIYIFITLWITALYYNNHPYYPNRNKRIKVFVVSIITIVTGIYDSRWRVF